jgi:hypothetical protein
MLDVPHVFASDCATVTRDFLHGAGTGRARVLQTCGSVLNLKLGW